jgi:F-type H+-transporting ATPase subunit alpha
MRDAAANLRLDLAQYEEVKDFARFGAILDETTKLQLERGQRLVSVLLQAERSPVPLAVEAAEIWALKTGLLDEVPPPAIPRVEAALKELLGERAHVEADIATKESIDPNLEGELRRWVLASIPSDLNGNSGP